MKKKNIKLILISTISAAATAITIPVVLTSCAQSTYGKTLNNQNQKPSDDISHEIQNPDTSLPQPEKPIVPVEPQQPEQLIKEPTGTVLVNDESYANMISQQLPEMQILIPNDLDISSLTQQQLQEYVSQRVKLNLDSAISSVHEWNKERGYDSQNISVDKIKFEKDNSKPILYSFNNNNKNTQVEQEINIAIQYGDSNPVATNITLKKSNSISGTEYATDNEVLARIKQYLPNTRIDAKVLKKNIDKQPMLNNSDVDAFLKSRLDLRIPIVLAQQDLQRDELLNVINVNNLNFEFEYEGHPGEVQVLATYNESAKLRTNITLFNVYNNDQQTIDNIKLPRTPEPLKPSQTADRTWLDVSNCGTIDGMYPLECHLTLKNFDPELTSQYLFQGRAISPTFVGPENPNLINFKLRNIDGSEIKDTGILYLNQSDRTSSSGVSYRITENPFYRTRILCSNSQFTINNDEIELKADVRNTNPEAEHHMYMDTETLIDDTKTEIFWWDVTENKIVSNSAKFKVNKYDIQQTHEYKLIITSKGKRISPYKNFFDWQDISYVTPESIFVHPYDPDYPNGCPGYTYVQDFSTSSQISVNNGGYLDGIAKTTIRVNPINFGKDYKLTWLKNNQPIQNHSNLSIIDDNSLTYTPDLPGSYTVQIFDGNNILLHTSKAIEIKENILKGVSKISVGGVHSGGFENWNDLFHLLTTDTTINLPPEYQRVPDSYKVDIYDLNSNTIVASNLKGADLYGLKYDHKDLRLKIKSKVTLYNKIDKSYIDITYEQPDLEAITIRGFTGEFDLNKPTNPTEEDKKIIECFRWAVKKYWSVHDDPELRDMQIKDVTERELNGYYLLKQKLLCWLVHFYPEYDHKVKPTNIVLRIKDRDLVKGSLIVELGYASDAVNFAWSDFPIEIKGFDNNDDQKIADLIAEKNQYPHIFVSQVPVSILKAGYGYINNQSLMLDLSDPELETVKKYNITFHTTYQECRQAYDNFEKNKGLINVYVGFNGSISKKPIPVYGFKKIMLRDYYYTAKENAEYFANFNKNNPNLKVIRDIFPSNIINNEININDVLLDDMSWTIDAAGSPGFYTDRLSRDYFSFETTKEWRQEAMESNDGHLKVRVKFKSPIDNSTALSDTVLTLKGLRTYKIQHDNNQVYTDNEIANMLFKWNDPGFRRAIVINDPELNRISQSHYWSSEEFYNYFMSHPYLLTGISINKLPKQIDASNIKFWITQTVKTDAYIDNNGFEYDISLKIGYKSPQNKETMWSAGTMTLIIRDNPNYQTFDVAKMKNW